MDIKILQQFLNRHRIHVLVNREGFPTGGVFLLVYSAFVICILCVSCNKKKYVDVSRVVREFGLPDTTVEIMQSSQSYYLDEQLGGPEAHTVPQYRTPTRHAHTTQVAQSPSS